MRALHHSFGDRGLVIAAVIVPAVMQNLNMTILNLALPHLQSGLSAGQEETSWLLTSYLVSSAVALPLVGYIGAWIGARRILVAAVLGFALASLACAVAQTLEQLVAFRCIQGAFGAAFLPMSQTILLNTYPRDEYAKAMSWLGIGVMVAPVFGPFLGGYLMEHFNWQAIFLINLPIAAVALTAILAAVPNRETRIRKSFDFTGYILLTVAIGLLQLLIHQGESRGWLASSLIAVELIAGLSLLYFFVVRVLTRSSAFLDPELFQDRNYAVALVLNFVIGGLFFASLALLPLFLQTIVGYPVLTAGTLLVPRGAGMLVGFLVMSAVPSRTDPRWSALGGCILLFLSLMEMAGFTGAIDEFPIYRSGFVQGCGLGILYVSIATTAFATLKSSLQAEGAALFSLVRSVGSSFTTAALFAFLARNVQVNQVQIATLVTPIHVSRNSPWLELEIPGEQKLALLESMIAYQSASISMQNAFAIMMLASLLLIPLILALRKPDFSG